MEALLAEIKELMEAFQSESTLFLEKENKSAAARARKTSLGLVVLLKQFRKESV